MSIRTPTKKVSFANLLSHPETAAIKNVARDFGVTEPTSVFNVEKRDNSIILRTNSGMVIVSTDPLMPTVFNDTNIQKLALKKKPLGYRPPGSFVTIDNPNGPFISRLTDEYEFFKISGGIDPAGGYSMFQQYLVSARRKGLF